MKIPKYARYDYCSQKAYDFLNDENFINLPIDAITFIENQKWGIFKYSELAKLHNVTIDDICDAYGSKEGYTIFNGENYTIAYNDVIEPKGRIYFTLMHEIGHIKLNHFVDFEQTILRRFELTKYEYKVLENEANGFARNVVAPPSLMKKIKNLNSELISDCFKITPSAAETRIGLLKYDLKYLSPSQFQFQINWFNSFMYKKSCSNCGHGFVSKKAKYCSICGHNKLKWGDGKMKYNDGYELDTNGKILKCPQCANEQMLSGGDYCEICGIGLVNKCLDENGYDITKGRIESCGKIADGSARYCKYCGDRTTFLNWEFLKDWKTAKKEIEAIEGVPF